MSSRIYVHSEFLTEVKLAVVDEEMSIEDMKKTCIALLPPEAHGVELILFIEDEEDATQAKQVKHLKKPQGIRVHLHRCKKVVTSVRFAGQAMSHKFPPGTTIGHIRDWAGHKFGLKPNDIAEHVLQLAGSQEQPENGSHIGTYAKCPACSVEFDLVPAHRING